MTVLRIYTKIKSLYFPSNVYTYRALLTQCGYIYVSNCQIPFQSALSDVPPVEPNVNQLSLIPELSAFDQEISVPLL